MKTIVKLILPSILLLAMTAAAAEAGQGQNGQGRQGNGPRMQHMQQALNLSDEQVSQIRDIRANGGGRDEVRAVLNDEQRAMMDEHRANRQGRENGARRGPGYANGEGYRGGRNQPQAESDTENSGGQAVE